MRTMTMSLALFLAAAVVTHAVVVATTPASSVGRAFDLLASRGVKYNEVNVSPRKRAGEEPTGMANPNVFAVRAMLDLSDGPLLFSAQVPPQQAYWSVSVFASNTDVVALMSDRELPTGEVTLVFATEAQRNNLESDLPIVSLPDPLGYAYIRSYPVDPNELMIAQLTLAALYKTTLEPFRHE